MEVQETKAGDLAQRVRIFNSLMRDEFSDEQVKNLLEEVRQADKKHSTSVPSRKIEDAKNNLRLLLNLHKENPGNIDVPQLFKLPKQKNVRKLPLSLILSRYSEQAKDVLASEDEYNADNEWKSNGHSSCSFLHTLKNSMFFEKHGFTVNKTEKASSSPSSGDSLCDAVSQMSSTSSARDEENSKISFGLVQEPLDISEEQEFNMDLSKVVKECLSASESKQQAQFSTVPAVQAPDSYIGRIETDAEVSSTTSGLDFAYSREFLNSFYEFQACHLYSDIEERVLVSEVWAMISNNRHAYLFSKPVRVKGYLQAVKKPTDLSQIKKKLDKKEITTAADLKLELLRMFANAVMFNSSTNFCNQAAKEMAMQMKRVMRNEKWNAFIGECRNTLIQKRS